MGKRQRRRLAWMWGISYTFASCCLSGAVWAYLSFFYQQAHADPQTLTAPLPLPPSVVLHDIATLGSRAVCLVLIVAFPGFELNQQVWKALRARPRRVIGVAIYGHKLLAFNITIVLAAPLLASLQFALFH